MQITDCKHLARQHMPPPIWAALRAAKQRATWQLWAAEGALRWWGARHTLDLTPPLVIGGTGGSGTRVVARIAEGLGVFMGRRLNRQYDAATLFPFFAAWSHAPDLADVRRTPAELLAMRRDLDRLLLIHRRGISAAAAPWGFKIPRSIFYLAFLIGRFPQLRLIHVVRDGRDMAFSQNQFQLAINGESYLPDLRGRLRAAPPPVRSIALWSALNRAAAAYGAAHLGPRYLRVRFEDLCAAPATTIATIAAFLDRRIGDLAPLAAMVEQPPSVGRWRAQAPHLVAQVCAEGEAGLRAFGYR